MAQTHAPICISDYEQARASRATRLTGLCCWIILWDYSMELYYGIRLQDDMEELYYEIVLRDHITELHHGIILRHYISELDYGIIVRNYIMGL